MTLDEIKSKYGVQQNDELSSFDPKRRAVEKLQAVVGDTMQKMVVFGNSKECPQSIKKILNETVTAMKKFYRAIP